MFRKITRYGDFPDDVYEDIKAAAEFQAKFSYDAALFGGCWLSWASGEIAKDYDFYIPSYKEDAFEKAYGYKFIRPDEWTRQNKLYKISTTADEIYFYMGYKAVSKPKAVYVSDGKPEFCITGKCCNSCKYNFDLYKQFKFSKTVSHLRASETKYRECEEKKDIKKTKEQIIVCPHNNHNTEYMNFDYFHSMFGYSPKFGFVRNKAAFRCIADGEIKVNNTSNLYRRSQAEELEKLLERKQIFGKGEAFEQAIEKVYKVFENILNG